jgi:hypothetical protein
MFHLLSWHPGGTCGPLTLRFNGQPLRRAGGIPARFFFLDKWRCYIQHLTWSPPWNKGTTPAGVCHPPHKLTSVHACKGPRRPNGSGERLFWKRRRTQLENPNAGRSGSSGDSTMWDALSLWDSRRRWFTVRLRTKPLRSQRIILPSAAKPIRKQMLCPAKHETSSASHPANYPSVVLSPNTPRI